MHELPGLRALSPGLITPVDRVWIGIASDRSGDLSVVYPSVVGALGFEPRPLAPHVLKVVGNPGASYIAFIGTYAACDSAVAFSYLCAMDTY